MSTLSSSTIGSTANGSWWNGTTTPTTTPWYNASNATTTYNHAEDQQDYYIGLALAVGSSLFIGTSYILKKVGLKRAADKSNVHASEGSVSYLRDWVWWVGMILMGIGEVANFVAYGYAPAMLVTPLGALSVIVSSILSSRFLHETLNLFGQAGCVLCVVGSTLIVINAPQERTITNMDELAQMLLDPAFLVYVGLVLVANGVLIIYCVPRWGRSNPLVYIGITGSMGSLTVMSCKSVGVALLQLFAGNTQVLAYWLTWVMLAIAGACIAVQMNFLNRALDAFNTAIVSTILYIMFSTFVLIASALLFKEWGSLAVAAILNIVCGFIVIVVAIFLISMFKELKLGWRVLIDAVFRHKKDAFQNVAPKLSDTAPDELTVADQKKTKHRKHKSRRLSESLSDSEAPIDNLAEPPARLDDSNGSGQLQNGFSNPAFTDEPLALNLANGADPLAVRFAPDSKDTPSGTTRSNGNTVTTRALVEPPNGGKSAPRMPDPNGTRYKIEDGTMANDERLQIPAEDPFSIQLEDSSASRKLFFDRASRSPGKATANGVADAFIMAHAHSLSSPCRITIPSDAPDVTTLTDRQTMPFPSYSATGEADPRLTGQGYSSRM